MRQREATSGQNSSAPRAAIRLPSAAAQWLSLPKSSRQPKKPQREAVQDVLLGEADRAVNLMCDRSPLPGGLGGADFCGGGFQENSVVEGRGVGDRIGGRAGRGHRSRNLARKPRQIVLDSLEFGDRPLEGDTLVGVAHR